MSEDLGFQDNSALPPPQASKAVAIASLSSSFLRVVDVSRRVVRLANDALQCTLFADQREGPMGCSESSFCALYSVPGGR